MPEPAALSPHEKAKQREHDAERKRLERKAKKEAEAAAAAKKLQPGGPSDASAEGNALAAATPAPELERNDEDRARDASVFLQGVWLVAGAVAWLFGWELDKLEEREAVEDGKSWVPIARRYSWFDVVITWAAAPVNLFRRVKAKLRRIEREDKKPEQAKPPAGAKQLHEGGKAA